MADFDVEEVLKKLTVSEKVDLLAGKATLPLSVSLALWQTFQRESPPGHRAG